MQEFELNRPALDFRSKEAFKTLRTNIEFSGNDVKVIALTSATPNEGKSSISFELAITFAEAGKKTLLIDADLRKSVMRSRFSRGKIRYGFTHFLAGKREAQEVMCVTDIENLYMIFAGPVPPNPSELLGGERFRTFIEACRKDFDIIVIDTPPIGSVIDAAVISTCCDGVAVVMAAGEISYKFAQRIKKQLEVANAKVLGLILNKVSLGTKGYYGKYYGKYYSKYYGNYGDSGN